MPTRPTRHLPRTAGELRRFIAANGYPWTVDPRLRDSDPLPKRPRGGKSTDGLPSGATSVNDVAAYLRRRQPPSNPFLRERRIELRLLERHGPNSPAGSSPQAPPAAKENGEH
jgi:hypothetical protein